MRIHYDVSLQQDPKRTLNGNGVLYPSTDNFFFSHGKMQAIFLDKRFKSGVQFIPDASYEYSDRLDSQFGKNVADDAWHKSSRKGLRKDSAERFEAYLRVLFNDPELKLVHILVGLNVGNGYPVRMYGFIRSRQAV